VNKRRAVSAVTLTVLVGLLVVGAVFGWRAMVAPTEDEDPAAARRARCDPQVARGDMVRPGDVKVSVYNAGTRSGLAGETLARLTDRGFRRGRVDNAPDVYASVRFVRVLAPTGRDPAAKLVALQFGAGTVVQRAQRNLGPGVEVVVGDAFFGLVKAPRKLRATAAGSGC
jgi:hypothetical protein